MGRIIRDNNRFKYGLHSSFLSVEKDIEEIINRLFLENKDYADYLKRLLVINTQDCLDDMESQKYKDEIAKCNIAYLKDNGYIKIVPKIKFPEHEEVKSYILITFDNFTPCTTNPYFNDCDIMIDVICHTDYWDIGSFRLRPFKIAGYIDALLNQARLSGLGELQRVSCNELILNENLSGVCLVYHAVHGNDDRIPNPPEE